MTTPFPIPSSLISDRYRDWARARRVWLATLSRDDALGRALEASAHLHLRRTVDAIARCCPTTREDLAMLLHVHWIEHGPAWRVDEAHTLEDAEAGERFIALMWRATTQREGWPRSQVPWAEGLE